MTRLVRLNEVQYAAMEEQAAGLVAQGFVPVPLETKPPKEPKEPKTPKDGKGKDKGEKIDEGGAEDNPSREGDEQH